MPIGPPMLIGVGIVAVFAASWIVPTLVYRWKGYDDPLAPGPPSIGAGSEAS